MDLSEGIALPAFAIEESTSPSAVWRSLKRTRIPFLKIGRTIVINRVHLPALRADLARRLVERQRAAQAKALRRGVKVGA